MAFEPTNVFTIKTKIMQDEKNTPMDEEANISPVEKEILDGAFENNAYSDDEQQLKGAELDNTDEDGTPLNEKSMREDLTGEDLDIPGAEDDDENEGLGEEDEENNSYSEADTD